MAARNVKAILPLTAVQEGILLEAERATDRGMYWDQLSVTITGPLEPERLDRAWNELVSAHDSLRTVFRRDERGRCFQIVLQAITARIAHLDWQNENPEGAEQRYQAEDRAQYSDPHSPPLFSVALARLPGQQHRLLIGQHHLIADGWSTGLLLRQLLERLSVTTTGASPPPLQPTSLESYVQRSLAADAACDLAGWTETLHPECGRWLFQNSAAELAHGDSPGAIAPVAAQRELAESATAALVTAAQRHQVTVATMVTAGWALCLAAETGQSTVRFGTTSADRDPADAEDTRTIGPMIRTVPLQLATDGSSLGPWLQSLQQTSAMQRRRGGAMKDLAAAAGQPGAPLFDCLLVIENLPLGTLLEEQDSPLRLSDFRAEERNHFPLTVTAIPGQEMRLRLHANVQAQDAATVERVADRFAHILTILSNPTLEGPAAMPWLLPGERPAVQAITPADRSVLRQVADQVSLQGQAPALLFNDQTVSYATLWHRAEQLRSALEAVGAGHGSIVAIHCARGPELVLSVLAIWLAGAIYVPVDPRLPLKRRVLMLKGTRPAAVIDQHCPEDLLAELDDPVPWINPQQAATGTGSRSATRSLSEHDAPEGLAYLIFTSGSTGVPKAVAVSQANIAYFFAAMERPLPLTPNDRLLAVTTISFDIALLELIYPLTRGASVRIAADFVPSDGMALRSALMDCTVLQATPAGWSVLLDAGWPGNPLLTAICGGEALPASLAAALQPKTKRLWNAYGPTESTVWSTLKLVGPPGTDITIGTPLNGTEAWVLDSLDRPLPPGVPGELQLRGPGTAMGYWDQPTLTAERFTVSADGVRGYRTGDRVYRDPNGELRFLGRMDLQVKVRGFRVELGEIERVLESWPPIARACVVLDPSDEQLLAAVTLHAQQHNGLEHWRTRLAETLPEYMIPAALHSYDELPLNASGKLDRRKITAQLVDAGSPASTVTKGLDPTNYPTTATEEQVATFWEEELGQPQLDCTVDFFARGGHSLQFARIQARLGALIDTSQSTLAERYRALTIRAQAQLLNGPQPIASTTQVWPEVPQAQWPTTVFQRRLWLLDKLEGSQGAHHVSLALRIVQPITEATWRQAATELATATPILRGRFSQQTNALLMRIHGQPRIELECHAAQREPDEQLSSLAEDPFDLENGPLWRIHLLADDPEQILLLVFHHAIVDAHAVALLAQRLLAAVRRLERADQNKTFPSVSERGEGHAAATETVEPLPFGSFAAQQDLTSDSEPARAALAYWQNQLRNPLPILALPTAAERPAMQSFSGDEVRFTLDALEQQALVTAAQELKVSLNALVLSAYAAVLLRYSDQTEVIIGTATSLRALAADNTLADVIGPLVNTLPLRLGHAESSTLADFVQHTARVQLTATAYQQVPFEQLLATLPITRDLGRTPVFQAFYSFQRSGIQHSSGFETVPVKARRARTDISCWVDSTASGLSIGLEYATALFERAFVEQLGGHLRRTLSLIATASSTPLKSYPLLSDADVLALIRFGEGPAGEMTDTVDSIIPWVDRADHTACETRFGAYTYQALNAAVDREAQRFVALGIQPHDLVGLALTRGPDALVSMLSLWRLGAWFVPLDPDYPAQRLAYIIGDANLEHLLCDAASIDVFSALALPAGSMLHEVEASLADPAKIAGTWESGNTAQTLPQYVDRGGASANRRAYMLYTSGSTGEPKGVPINHSALSNFLQTMQDRPGIHPPDRLFAITTLSFDIAFLELLLPLTAGATVYLADKTETQNGPALLAALERTEPTTMQATPSSWRLLLQAGWIGNPKLTILCGGEPLDQDLAQALLLRCHRLWNMYGPTETTIWSTCGEIKATDTAITIGRPVANTVVAVVDAGGDLQPIGVPGELLIGGAGVAEGYWNRGDQSAERFLPAPAMLTIPAAAMAKRFNHFYRTGDRAVWDHNGRLRCLGRSDNQVKLRGHRLELGEVEAALRSLPGVRDAAARVHQRAAGDERLLGYIVGTNGLSASDALLELRRLLPSAAVPQQLMRLDALPLTPNGKLDRQALPTTEPSAEGTATDAPITRAPTSGEQLVMEVASEVLGTKQLSLNGRFFELGGHSLLAITFAQALEARTGEPLSLASIVLEPLSVIAAQVDRIESPPPLPVQKRSVPVSNRPINRWLRFWHRWRS